MYPTVFKIIGYIHVNLDYKICERDQVYLLYVSSQRVLSALEKLSSALYEL